MKEKDRIANVVNSKSFILSMILFVGTFGHLCNAFYLQAIIPLCIVGLTSFSFKEKKMIKIGLTFTMLFSLSFYVLNNGKDLVLQNKMQLANYASFHRCFEAIPEIERDSIYNYNLSWYATSMMEHEKTLLNNRVLYSTLVFTLPTLREEEAKKNIIPPKWMLLSFDKEYIEEDKLFILENYEQYCSFVYDYQVLDKPRIGDRFQVSLYRRKEGTIEPRRGDSKKAGDVSPCFLHVFSGITAEHIKKPRRNGENLRGQKINNMKHKNCAPFRT